MTETTHEELGADAPVVAPETFEEQVDAVLAALAESLRQSRVALESIDWYGIAVRMSSAFRGALERERAPAWDFARRYARQRARKARRVRSGR